MVANLFESLLQELGKTELIPIQGLHPDGNNSCLIRLKGGIEVQLELAKEEGWLLVGCDLGQTGQGKYREDILTEALRANGCPYPRWGDLAFSQKSDHLVLQHKMATKDLNGEKIADFLAHFIEKAFIWKNALEHNEIPPFTGTQISRPMGMFGLRP